MKIAMGEPSNAALSTLRSLQHWQQRLTDDLFIVERDIRAPAPLANKFALAHFISL